MNKSPLSELLLSQWHPTKNGDVLAKDVAAGSNKKFWWICSKGHSYELVVAKRMQGQDCRYCSGRLILTGFNDITTLNPHLAAQWHPTKNETIDIYTTSPTSKLKVWWLDSFGHEWKAEVKSRHYGNGCPFCANRQILTGYNDMATTHPLLSAEWHPAKNGDNLPNSTFAAAGRKYWWLCSKGHEWEALGSSRVSQGVGCPFCSNKRIEQGFNDFATTNPDMASEWHPTKNGDLTPQQVVQGSAKKVWWQDSKGHEWEATLEYRSHGNNCPFCSSGKLLQGFNDLATTHPELANEWSPNNVGISPTDVTAGSDKKGLWVCGKGHEWTAAVQSRKAGSGCPVCIGQKIVVGFNDLATLMPTLAKEWHPTKNGGLTSQQVTNGTRRKVWWLGSCTHEWEAMVQSRTGGTNCPTCDNKKLLLGFNDLTTTHPFLAAQWHPTKNGIIEPTMVIAGFEKVWWLGPCKHEWMATVSKRKSGNGCPLCVSTVSKAEQEIHSYLVSVGLQVVQSERKLLKGQEIDLYIPEKKIGIEFNGLYWHSEDGGRQGKDRNYHYAKWLAAKEVGVQLIQVWEDEWQNNPELVKNMLAHKLGVSTGQKTYARKTKVAELGTKDVKVFMGQNHIQGFASGSYYLGLKDLQGVLKAVLVLKKEPDNTLNIIRYATSANIVGGFTKLLSYATKTYAPCAYITFADHCVSDGGLYENNGFTADKELPPDYMYVVNKQRKHKFGYRLKRFRNDPDLLWEDGLTERELAVLNSIPRIWDAGKTRYRLVVKT